MKEKERIAVSVTTETSQFGSVHYFHVVLRPMTWRVWDNGGGEWRYSSNDNTFQDLQARCQTTSDSEGSYAWHVEYRNVFAVGQGEAKRMYTFLHKIESKLDKYNESFGRPGTFGAYALRFAQTIGATSFVFRSKDRDGDDQTVENRYALGMVDGLIADFHNAHNPSKQENELSWQMTETLDEPMLPDYQKEQ